MFSLVRKTTRLTARELVDLCRAQVALMRAQLALWTTAKGTLLTPAQAPPAPPLSAPHRVRAGAIGWAITRAAHYGLFRPKCLARSLAIQRMLQREGILGSRLHLGVRPAGAGLLAHAWVTLEGRVLGDDPAFVADFRELPGTAVADLL